MDNPNDNPKEGLKLYMRAKRAMKYGIPMDSGEDDYEQSSLSSSGSKDSFCYDKRRLADVRQRWPIEDPFEHWWDIAQNPPPLRDLNLSSDSSDDELENGGYYGGGKDRPWFLMNQEHMDVLVEAARIDIETVKAELDEGERMDEEQKRHFAKRCARRYVTLRRYGSLRPLEAKAGGTIVISDVSDGSDKNETSMQQGTPKRARTNGGEKNDTNDK